MPTLYASAYQVFKTRGGTVYTADLNGAIVNVAAKDVRDLEAGGATVVPNSPSPATGNVSLTEFATNVDGTMVDATGGAGKFKKAITLGTSTGLAGETAHSNTKTDDFLVVRTLPPSYVAGTDIIATVNAKIAGSGTPGTKTIQVKAYRTATDGSQGSNLVANATQNLTTSNADYAFTIAGATLGPNDKIMIEVEVVLQETGGVDINAQVNSVRLA